jgi:O-antigen ligase
MLLTYQRGGWYALLLSSLFAAGMSAVLYLRRPGLRKWGLAILGGSALLIAAGGVGLWIGARNEESPLAWRMKNAFRVGDRRDIWASALELSRRYPWGAGLGFYYLKHTAEFPEWHPYHYVEQGTAHNHCLHVLVESGPFAVLCLLAALLITSWRLTRAWWNSGSDYGRAAWTIGCLAILAGWLLHGMVQYMAYIRVVDLMFYALLAFSMTETDEASAS